MACISLIYITVFLRGVKKPYPSCLSAATSAGQISKKHSRDTHVNLFSAQRTACLAGLSDRRLRHKHTSFWMYHKDNAHGSYDGKPAFCDKHYRRQSRVPVRNRCRPGFGVRVLSLSGPMGTRPQDGYLFKGFLKKPSATYAPGTTAACCRGYRFLLPEAAKWFLLCYGKRPAKAICLYVSVPHDMYRLFLCYV